MAIDSIDRVILQTILSAVQQENKKAEKEKEFYKRVKLKAKQEIIDEVEIPLVDPKDAPIGIENLEVKMEKGASSASKHRGKTIEEELLQESYLGKNIDLKG